MADLKCPVDECERLYRSDKGLTDHMTAKHPNWQPAEKSPPADDIDKSKATPDEETKKLKPPTVEDKLALALAENERLREELLGAKGDTPAVVTVKPITDKVLAQHVRDCAKLVVRRNLERDHIVKKTKQGLLDEAEEHEKAADVFDSQAAEIAAKVACVKAKNIMARTRRDSETGDIIRYDYAVNVRNGALRIVLTNGSRVKVDVRDVHRAKWDYTHDRNPKSNKRIANRTPAAWQGRDQVPVMRK